MEVGIDSDVFTSESTTSILSVDRYPVGFTIELPWMDGANIPNVSAILPGDYVALPYFSPRFKRFVLRLQDVPRRTAIEFHPANKASELLGCIAPGLRRVPNEVLDSVLLFDRVIKDALAAYRGGKDIIFKVRR